MNKNILKVMPHVLASTALFIAGTEVVSAQDITNYVPLTTLPGVFKAGVATNPVSVVKGLYGLAIGAGSIIAVVMIILAGFKYMYEESITGKSGAKEQIENAFLGLLVILGSYILLRTVNADLVNFNPELPGGSGKISGLVAADRYTDLTNKIKELQTAQIAVNKLKAEVTKVDGDLAKTQKDFADLGCDKEPTKSGCSDIQTRLTALTQQRTTANNAFAVAQINQQKNLGNLATEEQMSNKIAEAIKNLRRDDSGEQSGSALDDFDDFLDTVSTAFQGQKSNLDARIAAINKIEATTAEISAQKVRAIAELSQEKTYIQAASIYFAEAEDFNDWNSTGFLSSSQLGGLVSDIDRNTAEYKKALLDAGLPSALVEQRVKRDKELLMSAYANYEEVQERCKSVDRSKYPGIC